MTSATPRFWLGLLLAVWISGFSSNAAALDIQFELEDHGYNPSIDPDGSKLLALFNAAASYWEGAIKNGTVHYVDVWWEPIDSTTYGRWDLSLNPFGDNDIRINPNFDWFLDDTPLEHSEFFYDSPFAQELYRDLNPPENDDWYNGDPAPRLLEVGYNLSPDPNYGAADKVDALYIMIHELGHELGINNTDLFSSDFTLLGVPGSVTAAYDTGGHIADIHSVMYKSGGENRRFLPSAVDLLAVAYQEQQRKTFLGIPGAVQIDLPRKLFFSGNNWNSTSGWIGFAVPDAADDVSILEAQFATLTAPAFAGSLLVDEGSIVTTSNRKLDVTGRTLIRGVASTIQVQNGGELESSEIIVSTSATLSLFSGGLIDAGTLRIAAGTGLYGLTGSQTTHVSSLLTNDGVIFASGGSTMFFTAGSTQPWNLDGDSEMGVVDASAGNVWIQSGSMRDLFSGTIKVGAGRYFAFNNDWAADKSARIELNGGADFANRARIAGGVFSLASVGSLMSISGLAHLDAPYRQLAGTVTVAPGGTLVCIADAELAAGALSTAQGANIDFNGATTISTGVSFTTFNTSATNGDIEFNGPTTYAGGTVFMNGIVRQDGNASVSSATTLNVTGVFDMDGSNATATNWTINKGLTINADYVEIISLVPSVNPNNVVQSTISISHAGANNVLQPDTGSLAINLTNNRAWNMAGTLNLDGSTNSPMNFVPTMISGTTWFMTGTLTVQDRAAISAPTHLLGFTDIHSNSSLTLSGASSSVGGTVTGAGALFNTSSSLALRNGLYLGVSLANHGGLEVGLVDTTASVITSNFTQGPAGSIHFDLAGTTLGTLYDHVSVFGSAQLGGSLVVELLNGFVPMVGQSFDLFDWEEPDGEFATLDLPMMFGRAWDTSQLYSDGLLRVVAFAQLAGDYNRDGVVNAADYTVWRDKLGSRANLAADGNLNGMIDEDDYAIWKTNFGLSWSDAATRVGEFSAAPEASSLVLLQIGLAAAMLRRPRRRLALS